MGSWRPLGSSCQAGVASGLPVIRTHNTTVVGVNGSCYFESLSMLAVAVSPSGSAEVTNDFLTRPYLVEPATIRGAKIYFQPRRTVGLGPLFM